MVAAMQEGALKDAVIRKAANPAKRLVAPFFIVYMSPVLLPMANPD
jgi:hypothetical protein